jgi:hypothetical protein
MYQFRIPQDSLTTEVIIDMIDSAKYQDYGISWEITRFNIASMKKSKDLEFAAFNQFIKRR